MPQQPQEDRPRVTFLGGAAIQHGGVPIGGRATHRHPLALLAVLVVNRGRQLTRDKLIALLWPERDSESGRNLLKVSVHELRKVLGDEAIRSTGDQLSADTDALSCDVTDFLAAVGRGDNLAAAELYAGPLLDGFYLKEAAEFERWCDSERARLSELFRSAVEHLAVAAEAAGDQESVVRWRRAQAETDPYSAEAADRLIRALAACGDHASAIRFAEAFAQRRTTDLGIEDDAGVTQLARGLVASQRRATPLTNYAAAGRPAVPGQPDHVAAAPTEDHPSDAMAHGWSRRSAAWSIAGLVVVAIIAIVTWRELVAKPPRTSAGSRSLVAVLPFDVVGADSALGVEAATLLAARFNGEAGPQAVDAQRTVAAWRAMRPGAGRSDEHDRDVARSVGATEWITGELVQARDSIAITARLYDASVAAPVAFARADAKSGTSAATMSDQLAIKLLARAAGEPDDRIPGLANRPLAAARSYIAGQIAYHAARYALAESLYAVSLADDSTFGAAGLGLAMANSWTVINDHYGMGRDAALHHLRGMSQRDSAFAEAFFGPDPALGPPQPAPVYLKRWEDLVEKYPDWTEAWYQLGDRYYHYGNLSGLSDATDRARTAFRRAQTQDSNFAAPLNHLVELYAARGEQNDLRDAAARYFRANPTVNRDRSAIGWQTAMALGDSVWLRRIRSQFDSMPPEELTRIGWVTDANGWPRADAMRAADFVNRDAGTASEHEKALILQFALDLNAGDPRGAHAAAVALGAQFPDRPIGALWDLYAGLFGDGDTALAASAARGLAAFARAPAEGDHVRRDQAHLAACLEGYWSVTRGDLAVARSAAGRVAADLPAEDNNFARRNADVCLAMLRAAIAVAARSGDAADRVARLDTILLEQRVPPHAILEAATIVSARLHAALGDTAGALVAARRREHLTGDPVFLSTELREEARYAAALGDRNGAARASARLRALRSGG